MNEIRLQEIPPCVVCHNELNEDLNAARCGHVFHRECIERSILMNSKCPTCRKPLEKNQVINLIFKVNEKILPISPHTEFLLDKMTNCSEENFSKLKHHLIVELNEKRKLEIKMNKLKEELSRLQLIFNESIKSRKDKIWEYFKTRMETNMQKKSLEKQNKEINLILSEVTEEKIKSQEKYGQLEKENNYIKERLNIFENCFNIEEIDRYVNELNANINYALEEKNVMLSDLLCSLGPSLREGKKRIEINLSPQKKNVKINKGNLNLNEDNNVILLDSERNESQNKILDINSVNLDEESYIDVLIDQDEKEDISKSCSVSHKYDLNYEKNMSHFYSNFGSNSNNIKKISSQSSNELWRKSDLKTATEANLNKNISEKISYNDNNFPFARKNFLNLSDSKDKYVSSRKDSCDNITVELGDYDSRHTTFRINSVSKSPFNNKVASFLNNKNDSAINSPSCSNLFRKINQANPVINLNSASNFSNFSNLSGYSRPNSEKGNLNQNRQSSRSISNNLLDNFHNVNNSSFKKESNKSRVSDDSHILGNKRRYTKLKSLDKNQNLKQISIRSMLNFKNS